MRLGRLHQRTGHGFGSWPVTLLLLVVVLLPTVGVLWFMGEAMGNERLAVRQKLSEVYRAQLLDVQGALEQSWRAQLETLEVPTDPGNPAQHFADTVRAGWVDGLVLFAEDGSVLYPATPSAPTDATATDARWRRAERFEHSGDPAAAAARYARIATTTDDVQLAARALQAQARCLVRAGQTEEALVLLIDELGRPESATALDTQGRRIVPSAQLRALELLTADDPRFDPLAETLRQRLDDYGEPSLTAPQRRFLMRQWLRLRPSPSTDNSAEIAPEIFPTLAAEELSQRYLDERSSSSPSSVLEPSSLEELWHVATDTGNAVALFETQRLRTWLDERITEVSLPDTLTLEIHEPGVEPDAAFLVSLPVGSFLPDWRLVLRPTDQRLFATAASQQIRAYQLTAALLVVAILLLAFLAARVLGRQMRLTRLKNDLLSTVSHELKTPLASMRLLVDTLLDDDGDRRARRDYLQLIAQENLRLSRLVDNFLTFSRMEQGRYRFDRRPVTAHEVVDTAVAAVGERFENEGCRFEIDLPESLPTVEADSEALVTVLLNLLDNAFKYSDGNGGEGNGGDRNGRYIGLRVFAEPGQLCFAVRDHGVGMSSREMARIFDRFYQVDQRLSRSASGCGLGLSIVRRIVDAHRGTIEVDSQPGKGSTFTVRLPAKEGAR